MHSCCVYCGSDLEHRHSTCANCGAPVHDSIDPRDITFAIPPSLFRIDYDRMRVAMAARIPDHYSDDTSRPPFEVMQ